MDSLKCEQSQEHKKGVEISSQNYVRDLNSLQKDDIITKIR